jgi:beta-ribofuranosylaminobenzene 5'-phosphate synthase
MTAAAAGQTVFVETAARLHFGVLDLGGTLGRWFGGVGAAAPGPTLCLSATPARNVTVEGDDAPRAERFARRFLEHHRIDGGVAVRIERSLPAHAGLGSGTQLALAVSRAIAELYGIPADAAALARGVGRGERSAIGTWTFAGGGLVVEGGHRSAARDIGPLIARIPFPAAWRCIVAVPAGVPRLSGQAEADAFARLPPPPEREAQRVSHLVLLQLLPSLVDGDLAGFGGALSAIQEITGRWFARIQGGTFAPGPSEELVRRMADWGAVGVGQSSWGPAVYGVVDGEESARRLAGRVAGMLDAPGRLYCGPFRAEGARIWRA